MFKKACLGFSLGVVFVVICGFNFMPADSWDRVIQGFAPQGDKDTILTGVSQTVDMSNWTAWQVKSTTAGYFRNMTSTTKVGTRKPIAADTYDGRVVGRQRGGARWVFINFTGLTGIVEGM